MVVEKLFIGRILAGLLFIATLIIFLVILIFLLPIMFFLTFLMIPIGFIISIFTHPGALKWFIVASLIIIAIIIATMAS